MPYLAESQRVLKKTTVRIPKWEFLGFNDQRIHLVENWLLSQFSEPIGCEYDYNDEEYMFSFPSDEEADRFIKLFDVAKHNKQLDSFRTERMNMEDVDQACRWCYDNITNAWLLANVHTFERFMLPESAHFFFEDSQEKLLFQINWG